MSAGSNNVVIQVTDGIDGTIAPKIRDIAAAAREANSYLVVLQGAVSDLAGGTGKLGDALKSLKPPLDDASGGTTRLTGAVAQLASRIAGAELGMGMLGGAFGRVAVAAGAAAPVIIAALALAAVGGAVLAYNAYEKAQLKVSEAQVVVATTSNALNDGLLKQQETLTGMVDGSLAKYKQELTDLPFKSIKVDLQDINKEMQDQDSFWDNGLQKIGSFVLRYTNLKPTAITPAPETNNDVKQFQTQLELQRQQGQLLQAVSSDTQRAIADDAKKYQQQSEFDQKTSLENTILAFQKFIADKKELFKQESDDPLGANVTRTAIDNAQAELNRYLQAYQKFLNDKQTATAGADGQLLAEQKKSAEEMLKGFNDQINQMKSSDGVVTPQQQLPVREDQKEQLLAQHPDATVDASPYHNVLDTLNKDIGNLDQQIAKQNRSLDELIQKYHDEAVASGAYGTALKAETEQRKAALEVEKLAPGNQSNASVITNINAEIAARNAALAVQKEETAIRAAAQGPLQTYVATITAANRLELEGTISQQAAVTAISAASRAYQDATIPLNAFNRELASQESLFGTYGTALTVATEVEKLRQDLQTRGITLTTQETAALTEKLTLFEQEKTIQSDINSLYAANEGQVETLTAKQEALNAAIAAGVISNTQYGIGIAQVNIGLANQALLAGKAATVQDQLIAGAAKFLSGYQGVAKGLSDAYGNAFSSIANGAANSLGHAIVYGNNLGKALRDVARQGLSELLSAFIKLGLQYLVNAAIGQAAGETAVATSVAQAQTVATAWAPAAAFASLASFGANAAPAAAAVSGTLSLTEAFAAIAGHSDGGYISGPGTSTSDSILARLSDGEFVMNARATAQNRDVLEAMNRGASVVSANSVGTQNGTPVHLNVSVQHDGSTNVSVEHVDSNTVRVIARQEAQSAVHSQAPAVIAADMNNPNSRTSKALAQNVYAQRRR